MVEMTPELRAAIDVAKQRIHVDEYYTKAATKGLAGHAKGYIGGSMLGMGTGILAALTCYGAMALMSIALPASLTLGGLVLGAASMGVVVGGTVGSRVGASAGAVAAGLEERERRDKGDKLEQEILASPEKQREVIEAYEKNPVVEKSGTIDELYKTHSTAKATAIMFDWKTMLFAGLLCAAVGALVFAGCGAMGLPIGWGLLASESTKTLAVMGAGLGFASGASFGIAYPAIFGSLVHRASDMLVGNMTQGKSDFVHAKSIPELQNEAQKNHAISRSMLHDAPPVLKQHAMKEMPRTHIHAAEADSQRLLEASQQLGV